jgi:hypothetical protein
VSLPLDAAGKRPTFFPEAGVDELLSMVLELAAELWVVRERLYRAEAVAEATTPGFSALVESAPLTAEQEAELSRMRETFTRGLFRSLGRRTAGAGGVAETTEAA